VRGAPLFSADREHLHHRLLDRGLSPREVSLVLCSLTALLAGIGMTLAGCDRGVLVIAVIVAGALAMKRFGVVRVVDLGAVRARRRRNLARRRAIRSVGAHLRGAQGLVDVCGTVQEAVPVLGAESIALDLAAGETRSGGVDLRGGSTEPLAASLRTKHSIGGDRGGVGWLEVEWPAAQGPIDRDLEIAVESLCGHVAVALERIEARSRAPRVTPGRRALAPESVVVGRHPLGPGHPQVH
jgi:UDP-GlcNAc:undecaprenyl-phosphate GlcNAc-1-phosphate transferase